MRPTILMGFLCCLQLVLGCDDDEARYEVLDKLRGFGVESDPIFLVNSTDGAEQTVTLTFHAVVPLGHEVSAEPYVDSQSSFSFPVETLSTVDGSETYTDYQHFRHYSIQATFDVGDVSKRPHFALDGEGVALRYGMKLNSPGEEEKMVGDLIVAEPTAAMADMELSAPEIEVEPAEGSGIVKDDEVDIKATYELPDFEKYKIGWFVNDGELESRRARETTWLTGTDDVQTLIFTVRGKKSKMFAYKIVEYSAN